jgi:phage gp36-like protein
MKASNADLTQQLNNETADHNGTKKTLARVQKELETEMAALAEARTKIIKVRIVWCCFVASFALYLSSLRDHARKRLDGCI